MALEPLVAALDPDGPPEARLAQPACRRGRIGLLPGSFNPPTDAHVALAGAGRAAGLACVYYLLSKRTVGKEEITGIPLADRLKLLSQIAAEDDDGVAFVNRGLYVDLARAMRQALPDAVELVFLVGHDKIVQIFDTRYYQDRGAALRELFELSSFLVAPRRRDGAAALAALLDTPENRPFADRVRSLPLGAKHRRASSTAVRSGASRAVPAAVAEYLVERRPFD